MEHSEAENIRGGAGRDILTGFGGDDILIGGEGIDNAIYRSQFADYEITQQSDQIWLVKQLNDGPDDTDIVAGIERLQFSDQWLALDLNGNAGIIAKTILKILDSPQTAKRTALVIGGGHYNQAANKLLERTDYAVGHICCKYNLPDLTVEKLKEAIERTTTPVDTIILDWKGLGQYKEHVKEIVERIEIEKKRIKDF